MLLKKKKSWDGDAAVRVRLDEHFWKNRKNLFSKTIYKWQLVQASLDQVD